jgi:hypothetical protein
MEQDHKVIITFLYNEGADTHDLTQRYQAEFAQDADVFRTDQLWVNQARRGCQELI